MDSAHHPGHPPDVAELSREELEALEEAADINDAPLVSNAADQWWWWSIVILTGVLILLSLVTFAKGARQTREDMDSGEIGPTRVMGDQH